MYIASQHIASARQLVTQRNLHYAQDFFPSPTDFMRTQWSYKNIHKNMYVAKSSLAMITLLQLLAMDTY